MKMRTEKGKWIIEDRGVNKIFDTAYDAWLYVFLMREIRPKVRMTMPSLYPVRTLNPLAIARGKKVVFTGI